MCKFPCESAAMEEYSPTSTALSIVIVFQFAYWEQSFEDVQDAYFRFKFSKS